MTSRRTTLTFRAEDGRKATVSLELSDVDVEHARETFELALVEVWGEPVSSDEDEEDEEDEDT